MGKIVHKYKIYVVRWIDAVYSAEDSDSHQSLPPAKITSIGFLTEITEDYITICSDYSPDETWVRNRNTIPLKYVDEYYELEEK